MYSILRPFLFRLDPEIAHSLTLNILRITGRLSPLNWLVSHFFQAPHRPRTVFGLTFPNSVGLAAGYDKDGIAIRGLSALGFGHIELGTVTPYPQPGNPKPRIFRLVEDEAIINRMGFPGRGAEFVASRLLDCPSISLRTSHKSMKVILGINLGMNRNTKLDDAVEDYLRLVRTFTPIADYLVLNISSPNTLGLRRLQGREMLENLLKPIYIERKRSNLNRPILVKLAPDLTHIELDDALDVIINNGINGIIATNTTIAHKGLISRHRQEIGGLSGKPLRFRSEEILIDILKRVKDTIPVISAGGIMNPEDAKRRLDLGAALVQIYTGLIYYGPGLVQKIIKSI